MLKYCLSLFALCILLCSCDRSNEASASSQPQFPLPEGWPLEQISTPLDAAPAPLPAAFPCDEDNPATATKQTFNPRSPDSGEMWCAGYTSSVSWEDQLRDFSLQHAELNYQLNWDKPLTREFISPDGLYITQLHLDVDSGVSVLSVFAYDDAWPGARPLDS